MDNLVIRAALATDARAIQDLTTRAFGQEDEARIIQKLEASGEALLQMVAEQDGRIIGHVMFYHIGVRGRLGAAGLGPMSVNPWVQGEGVGRRLVMEGLAMMREGGVPIVFVLGHDWFYPKFGFNVEATEPFTTSLKGPHFFGVRLRHGPPMSGELIFPRAFGVK
jgi:putative acetyltransferase